MRVFGPGDTNLEPSPKKAPSPDQSRPVQKSVGTRVSSDVARDHGPVKAGPSTPTGAPEGAVVVSDRVQVVQARHEEETARHAAHINNLREALDSGSYQIDAERLAERLLDEDFALRRMP